MSSMLSGLGPIIASALLGAMIFFAAGVAPQVFRALDPAPAGAFLRRLFPAYYAFIIAFAALGAVVMTVGGDVTGAGVFAAIALSTLAVRQILTPRINAWRDAELAGDMGAGRKFKAGHRASVLVNLGQMIGLTVLIVTALAV